MRWFERCEGCLSLIDADEYGVELRGLIRHAWELHGILQDQMSAEDSWVVDGLRTIRDEMDANLVQIDSLISGNDIAETRRSGDATLSGETGAHRRMRNLRLGQ